MIELYHSTHSTCSQKVRICLAEKGLAWTGDHLNLRRFDQLKPEFLALNPAGLTKKGQRQFLFQEGFVRA